MEAEVRSFCAAERNSLALALTSSSRLSVVNVGSCVAGSMKTHPEIDILNETISAACRNNSRRVTPSTDSALMFVSSQRFIIFHDSS